MEAYDDDELVLRAYATDCLETEEVEEQEHNFCLIFYVVVSYLIDNKSLENVDIAMVLTLQLHLTSFLHPWLSYRSWCVLEQQVPNQVFL